MDNKEPIKYSSPCGVYGFAIIWRMWLLLLPKVFPMVWGNDLGRPGEGMQTRQPSDKQQLDPLRGQGMANISKGTLSSFVGCKGDRREMSIQSCKIQFMELYNEVELTHTLMFPVWSCRVDQ